MKLIASNPSWPYGYKFMGYAQGKDVALGIRNGERMMSFFLSPEDAKVLIKELMEAIEVINENKID